MLLVEGRERHRALVAHMASCSEALQKLEEMHKEHFDGQELEKNRSFQDFAHACLAANAPNGPDGHFMQFIKKSKAGTAHHDSNPMALFVQKYLLCNAYCSGSRQVSTWVPLVVARIVALQLEHSATNQNII